MEIISHCVWLYHRFPLSFRKVEEMMLERGVVVSHETVRQVRADLRQRAALPAATNKVNKITFKVTGEHGSFASFFESVIPPGLDVGTHTHDRVKELFSILWKESSISSRSSPTERTEDRWQDWESSDETGSSVRARVAACSFRKNAHTRFVNPTDKPTRILFLCAPPPVHERYLEEIYDILSADETVDSHAVERLRDRSGTDQITPFRQVRVRHVPRAIGSRSFGATVAPW